MYLKHLTNINMNESDNDTKKEFKDELILSKCIDVESGHHSQSKHSDPHAISFYHEKALNYMKTLKKDYKRLALIYNSCLMAEEERERKNIEEILQLQNLYHQMQNEKIDIKRKKWCRYCESEATYLSSDDYKFYCSQECEQKQQEFICAIDSSFKI